MKTLIASLIAIFTGLIYSFKKGQSATKQGDQLTDDKQTIQILSDQQQTVEHLDNITPSNLDSELQEFTSDNPASK